MLTASFTHPDRPWTVNGERAGHWAATRERTRQWRRAFWAYGLQQRIRFDGPVTIDVHVAMRKPLADTGACIGAVKAAIDGLVDARVLTGDTGNVVRAITLHAPVPVDRHAEQSLTLIVTG